MKDKKSLLPGLLFGLMLLLSACGSGDELETGVDIDVDVTAVTEELNEAIEAAAEALPQARQALAQGLAIAEEEIELIQIEDEQWTDTCLGLGGAAESCLQTDIPGFRITFEVNGETWEVRTDRTGETVRVEVDGPEGSFADEPDEQPPAVEIARQHAAQELGVDAGTIEVLSFEQRDWPDGCLGAPQPGEACTQAITTGWQVMLQANGQTYEVRTNQEGTMVRMVDAS